jgi:hypothetical protein
MKNGESLIDKSIRAVIVVLCHSYSDSLEIIGSIKRGEFSACVFVWIVFSLLCFLLLLPDDS